MAFVVPACLWESQKTGARVFVFVSLALDNYLSVDIVSCDVRKESYK